MGCVRVPFGARLERRDTLFYGEAAEPPLAVCGQCGQSLTGAGFAARLGWRVGCVQGVPGDPTTARSLERARPGAARRSCPSGNGEQ